LKAAVYASQEAKIVIVKAQAGHCSGNLFICQHLQSTFLVVIKELVLNIPVKVVH
jgi:hypothetical protein